MPTQYEAHARALDQRHHGVSADDVRRRLAAPGPVLTLLRTFPRTVGLAFGAYGEGSPEVHSLLRQVADAGSRQSWRTMGARTQSEAYGFLLARLQRSWGVAAARGAAHHRVARFPFVGMPTHIAQGLRRGAQLEQPGDAGGGAAGDAPPVVAPAAFMAGVAPAVDHHPH